MSTIVFAMRPVKSASTRRGQRACPSAVVACLLFGWSAASLGQVTGPAVNSEAPASNVEAVEPAPPEPLYAAPTRADRAGRIHAAVEINGQGPFRFILDTGANRSALAPEVVERLHLPAAEKVFLEVHGVTGSAILPAVHIESLRAGGILMPPGSLPVLPGDVFGRADGILGISGLQRASITVDFENDRVVIAPSTGRRPAGGYMVVPTRITRGGLLQARGRVGRTRVTVIIDTGAERSLGNMPLLVELQKRSKRADETDTNVIGATTTLTSAGVSLVAPTIMIGEAELTNLPFGDLHAFEVWGLTKEPALLIGMDLLGLLQQIVIDYRRGELYLKTYRAGASHLQHCDVVWCGTRIPEVTP
jgi:predicted aspartyl protease